MLLNHLKVILNSGIDVSKGSVDEVLQVTVCQLGRDHRIPGTSKPCIPLRCMSWWPYGDALTGRISVQEISYRREMVQLGSSANKPMD